MRKALRGVAVLTLVLSSLPLSAHGANALTIAPVATHTAAVAAASSCAGGGAPTATVYLPNITKTLGGPDGWDTPFFIENAGAVQTNVEASFYRFTDGTFVGCHRTTALAPGTSATDDPKLDSDLPDDTQFSVVLRSFGAAVVATVDQQQGVGPTTEGLSYSGFASGATTVYLPNVTRRFFGYDVPFIIQNVGTLPANVTARFVSFSGAQTLTVTRAIDPGKSKVIDPDSDDALFGANGLVDGTQYAVTLTSTQPIAVVANAHNEALGPVAFSHNGLATGATALYAPYAVKVQNGLFSPVVVQNVGAAATDATLTFYPLAGVGAAQVVTLQAIPAGGSRAFDPRFTLGTTTPCAIQSPICLGPGEYSLKIQSAVPVAAVVLPNSATTAAAYVAAPALQARSLLPVVMRTVGGPLGWTTSVFIQPGSATTATLRFYSIPAGDLVTTQHLALSANGVKLDPRTVTGLKDNARYAVTIDGDGGTLATVAHHLAQTGGDASMMYEGFPASALPSTPQPASLRVTPETPVVLAGAAQQFSAIVNDQFGEPLTGAPLTWSSSQGSVAPSGLFTAGATTATTTISATSGAVTTSVTAAVQAPTPTTVGGFAFLRVATVPLEIDLDPAITLVDRQRIVTQAIADIAQIQLDYDASYVDRPVLFMLSTNARFSSAALAIGGSAPATWAEGVCDCYGGQNLAFVDWSSAQTDISAIRHELTHAMEHDLSADADLPAWFNEGNAIYEEFGEAGTAWFATRERYRTAAMANAGQLFTLAALTSQAEWNARPREQAQAEYAEASQIVVLLRADVGVLGVFDIFHRLAQGVPFDDAYAAVAHRTVDQFNAQLATRLRALATAYPGVATAADTPDGPGLSFVVYGLPPNSQFTLSISGDNGYTLSGSPLRTADAYGVSVGYLSSGWPPGTYTISASYTGGVVSTVATKP